MPQSSIVFSFTYFDTTYTARSLGTSTTPPFNEVISAHALPMTSDGKIVAVRVVSRGVDGPGGHVEDSDHSPLHTLTREIDEEACIVIDHPALIDVLEISSVKANLGNRKYMLIYACNVNQIKDFVPTEEISERLIITPQEFIAQYFASKKYAAYIVQAATKNLAL